MPGVARRGESSAGNSPTAKPSRPAGGGIRPEAMASRVGNQMFWDRHTTGNERRRILRAAILLMNFANFLEKNKSSSKIL